MRSSELRDLAKTHLDQTKREHHTLTKEISDLQASTRKHHRLISERFDTFTQTQLAKNLSVYPAEIRTRLDKAKQEALSNKRAIETLTVRLSNLSDQIKQQTGIIEQEESDIAQLLRQDPHWNKLFSAQQEASHQKETADALHDDLRAEYNEKAPAYFNDPAFSYLLKRQFGTPGYTRSDLLARLDAGLARLIGFTELQQHFHVLEMIKKTTDNGNPELDAAYHTAQQRFAEYDDAAYQSETLANYNLHLNALLKLQTDSKQALQQAKDELAAFEQGNDEYSRSAHKDVLSYLRLLTQDELKALANATDDPADDAALVDIINALGTIEHDTQCIREQEDRLKQVDEKLTRAEILYSTASSSAYSGSRYRYRNTDDINAIFTGFLLGRQSKQQFESALRQKRETIPEKQVHRSPYSGSNRSTGFGSSGGFKTTGGFGGGGGGFKTTGGF